eukprot:CAMPEP_0182866266 /NCGR_PEP_ID=MMETSP0034_2-20130328/8116_1 /TAXON_ID=156128 /ORGANISM="Nephroselmis pyriformis, Strain CCMP717" /LENGTH=436 /DNA_ID=CAMNT_0024998593 /DNA_START=202 /DNA_END=1509 /DNA_ORIENTATION=+
MGDPAMDPMGSFRGEAPPMVAQHMPPGGPMPMHARAFPQYFPGMPPPITYRYESGYYPVGPGAPPMKVLMGPNGAAMHAIMPWMTEDMMMMSSSDMSGSTRLSGMSGSDFTHPGQHQHGSITRRTSHPEIRSVPHARAPKTVPVREDGARQANHEEECAMLQEHFKKQAQRWVHSKEDEEQQPQDQELRNMHHNIQQQQQLKHYAETLAMERRESRESETFNPQANQSRRGSHQEMSVLQPLPEVRRPAQEAAPEPPKAPREKGVAGKEASTSTEDESNDSGSGGGNGSNGSDPASRNNPETSGGDAGGSGLGGGDSQAGTIQQAAERGGPAEEGTADSEDGTNRSGDDRSPSVNREVRITPQAVREYLGDDTFERIQQHIICQQGTFKRQLQDLHRVIGVQREIAAAERKRVEGRRRSSDDGGAGGHAPGAPPAP